MTDVKCLKEAFIKKMKKKEKIIIVLQFYFSGVQGLDLPGKSAKL